MNRLIYASATSLAQAILNKEVSSEEVVDAHFQHIQRVNPKLNALVQLCSEEALTQAKEADDALAKGHIKGPLHGVPITVKDNIDVAGLICAAGTKGRSSYRPKRDATIVARMRGAGAIILGKTNMPELGLAFETDNLLYGRTNNPYDLSRSPGGSSGGEAAIISAGGSPLGLGNDMGGSIRVPAHFCGITGIKPTAGRIPSTGTFPWPSNWLGYLWQNGVMARFVEDLILTLPFISGRDWRDPTVVPMPLGNPYDVDMKSLQVAFHVDNGVMPPTAGTEGAVKKAADVLSNTGASLENDRPEGIEQSFELFSALGAADGGAAVEKLLQMVGTNEIHPWLQRLIHYYHTQEMTTAEFSDLMLQWCNFKSSMLSFMEKYDIIICPVCAYPAQKHGITLKAVMVPGFSYSMTYNLTGWPSVVVRVGTSPEGLPIGVQLVARPWREDVALAVAHYLEGETGGWQPPTSWNFHLAAINGR